MGLPLLPAGRGWPSAAISGRVQLRVFGETSGRRLPHPPALLPVFAHLALVLLLGLYIPAPLNKALAGAAASLGGVSP